MLLKQLFIYLYTVLLSVYKVICDNASVLVEDQCRALLSLRERKILIGPTVPKPGPRHQSSRQPVRWEIQNFALTSKTLRHVGALRRYAHGQELAAFAGARGLIDR